MSGILIIQFLVLTAIVSGVLIFFLKKVLFDSTQGAVNRLNRETEDVRAKQVELNEKIKQANEELERRRTEADALVAKMKNQANEEATKEREKLLTKVRQESEDIIAKAQRTKDDMRKELEREMNIKAMDYTFMLLNEALPEKTLAIFNEEMVTAFLDGLESVDMEVISEDVKTAEAVTAMPLPEKYRNRLSDILQKKLGRVIQVEIREDKKIINGMILKFGSLSLDGSLANVLKGKAEELKEKIDKGMIK